MMDCFDTGMFLYTYSRSSAEEVLTRYRQVLEESYPDVLLLLEEVVLKTKLLERVLEGLE